MLRKLLLLASLPLMIFPSASFAATPEVLASLSTPRVPLSETTNNQKVILSQFSPETDTYPYGESSFGRVQRRRCRRWREYLIYNSDFLPPRERRFQWRRYRMACRGLEFGSRELY